MAEVSKRVERAEKYFQKGKLEDALEEYLLALEENPYDDAIRQTAADVALSLGRSSDAAPLLGQLLDRHLVSLNQPKAATVYKKLARINAISFDQAQRFAQFSEKSSPKDAIEAYEHLVRLCHSSGRARESIDVLKRLLLLDPTLENHRRLAESTAQVGEIKEAASAFVQLALAMEKQGKDASEIYARAYELVPSNAGAALGYGRTLVEHGEPEKALELLEPMANYPSAPAEARESYGRALLAVHRYVEAEPFAWEMFERDQRFLPQLCRLIGALVGMDETSRALALARRLEEHQRRAGMRREFVAQMKEVSAEHNSSTEFLEYLAELYNSSNREHDYCDTLLRLFDLQYAAGNFLRAADALDRAAEVDPYEAGHERRLQMLRGKIEPERHAALNSRFNSVQSKELPEEAEGAPPDEPTVLEDLILQAEIFLQYSMRNKALERLERISKLFPHEEDKSEQLRQLYLTAGYVPQYEDTEAPAASGGTLAPPAGDNGIDNITRITEITRNIYRQANVKAVLFAAVNDVGRHWNASRCVAGLCTPGKPPSAALEYCASGIKQSDIHSIVKLITTAQALCVAHGAISTANARDAAELAPLQDVIKRLAIESLLAVPLVDGNEHTGILLLEQCDAQREWAERDRMVLRTIADQMVLAVHNVRLRSLVKTLAVTDENSGLLKRSSYIDVLLSEIRRAMQQKSPATVMLFDFGKASAMVREFGEPAVEDLMRDIGQVISSHVRQNDVAVRYDLTTIALVLADLDDKNAIFVYEKMRKLLATVNLPGKQTPVTLTAGIAEAVLHPEFDPVDIATEVINRAERALDGAKHAGPTKVMSLAPTMELAAG